MKKRYKKYFNKISVGAVLVLDNRILSTGYNGTPGKLPNCYDGGCERCNNNTTQGLDLDKCNCNNNQI